MTPFDLLGWACAFSAVIALLYGTAFGSIVFWKWWRIFSELPHERPKLKIHEPLPMLTPSVD